jgi:hypothetical protein
MTIGNTNQIPNVLDNISIYKLKKPPRKIIALIHIWVFALGDISDSLKYCSTLARIVAIKTGLDLLLNFNRVFIMYFAATFLIGVWNTL